MYGHTPDKNESVTPAPGANAAREILRDLRRPDTVPEAYPDD